MGCHYRLPTKYPCKLSELDWFSISVPCVLVGESSFLSRFDGFCHESLKQQGGLRLVQDVIHQNLGIFQIQSAWSSQSMLGCRDVASSNPPLPRHMGFSSIYRFIGPSKRTPVVLRTDLLLTGLFLVGVYMQVKLNSHWYVTIPNSNCLETFNRLDANRQCRLHFRPSCEDRIFCWNMFLWIQWGAKSLPGFVYIREFRFGSRTDQ